MLVYCSQNKVSVCCSQIEVLPSLARPKKITMLGSDGQLYTMLCKPKVCLPELRTCSCLRLLYISETINCVH